MDMKKCLTQTMVSVFTTIKHRPFVFGLLVTGLLVVSGYGQSQESARKELAALRMDFTTTDFIFSAAQGDKTTVALFLKAGMDVNAKVENGATALIVATVKKQPKIVKLLLDQGAKPDMKYNTEDHGGLTPLLTAIGAQAPDIVAMLLDKKADPNLASDNGMTPLMLACSVADLKVVTLLLEKGARIDTADEGGSTALIWAAEKQHPDVVSLLLKKGADTKVTSKDGATVLDAALGKEGGVLLGMLGTESFETMASKEQQVTVQVLRQAGVKPVSDFFTANLYKYLANVVTQRAANTRSAKDTREFLFNLFDNFKVIGFDDTQMAEARSQAVKWVAKAANGLASTFLSDPTPQEKRVFGEFTELFNELEADPQVKRLEASRQLFRAAGNGDLAAVKGALSKGANPDFKDESGLTPLVFSITGRHPELVPALIEAKANVNLVGHLGMTPLMMASALGDEGSVKLLLENGAKPEAINDKRQTALMIAKAQKQDAAIKLLEFAGARN